MSNPLVSVIITTYNRNKFLEQAIVSVVNQTYKNIEILVVDDGSNENYAEKICNKFQNCIYYFKNNGGISSARNYGIQHAKGEFIAFLDDDDLFMSHKIQKQLEILLKYKQYDCVHSSVLVINDNNEETGVVLGASENKVHMRSGYVFWNALGSWCVKSPTPFIRKRVFDKVLFDDQLQVGEDFDFYQRLFYFYKVKYIHEPLAYYRDSDSVERLSKIEKKYIGIESRFFDNYLKLGIKNPIILYRIAYRLAICGIERRNTICKDNLLLVIKWKLIVNPFYYVKNFAKK